MAKLTNRDSTSDDFTICFGAAVIVFIVYLVANAIF